jgi:phage anti-repressor protein
MQNTPVLASNIQLDIVNLIEKNPITRFSRDYQNKFIHKIQQKFSETQQHLFIGSFYCYLNYTKNDFVIDLENVWKWLGFSRKDPAKVVLEKHFIINVDYIVKKATSEVAEAKNFTPEVAGAKNNEENRGGHNKETILLNINTFKKLCLKSNTKKADEIHDYFIKLEETFQEIINEESSELRVQLLNNQEHFKQKDKKIKEKDEAIEKLIRDKMLEKHNLLLREFGNKGSIVYIIKVKTFENGQYIVKIGESRKGIESRYNEHKTNYEESLILDCFSVVRSKELESFIHNHKDVRINRVKDLPGHERENELFLIGKDITYAMLVNIIENNIKRFNDTTTMDEMESMIRKILTEHQIPRNEIVEYNNSPEILQKMTELNSKIDNLERTIADLKSTVVRSQTRTTTNFNEPLPTLGPRLQKIDPITLQLVQVYESVTECMRENPNIKRPSINKAVKENTIYCGFRWLLVDRESEPEVIQEIQPTKETRAQNIGYIAKLNAEKTQIIGIYLDRKTASRMNGYPSESSLDPIVKKKQITKGFYYVLYDECSETLKRTYAIPILYKDGVGKFNAQQQLVKEFTTRYDCVKTDNISEKTLKRALTDNAMYNGFYYRLVGEKLSI